MNKLDQNSESAAISDKLSQKRRALIKGSAVAIPAILTLRSGSALAATSLSCAAKIQQNPPVTRPDGTANTDDNWLRRATQIRALTNIATPSIQISVFQDPSDTTKWYNTNTNNVDKSAAFMDKTGTPNTMTSSTGSVDYSYSGTTTGYVTIQIDPNGKITGIYGLSGSDSFNLVTDSCFTSLTQ